MKHMTDYSKIIVFDVETTGFDPQKTNIIEFASVTLTPTLVGFEQTDVFNEFIQVEGDIPEKITELTGITKEDTESGIVEKELADKLITLFQPGNLMIAYNIQFDLGFTEALLKRHYPAFTFECDILDMLTVYKDMHEYPHKLENAIAMYDIQFPNSHRAIDDTLGTAELFKLVHENTDITPYINCIGYNAKYPLKGPQYKHVDYHKQYYQVGSFIKTLKQQK